MTLEALVLFVALVLVYHGMLFWELQKSRKEREELYNRLMARDFREYAMLSREHHQKQKEGFVKRAIEKAYATDKTEM